MISTQLCLASADESPVCALVDSKLSAFDLDLPSFELAPPASAAPVTPKRTYRNGRLLDDLRPFEITPRTLDLAYFELSTGKSFPAISEDAALSFETDYLALSPINGANINHESSLIAEAPLFLPPSDSYDDIVHRAVIDGVIPMFASKFILPADWEDVDDHLELALADGDDENLLEVDQPPHLPLSGSFDDDVVHLVAEGIIPPCPGDEFAALRTAYRKHVEKDCEMLQDVLIPALPSPACFEEGSTPLLSRATRRPMNNKPVTSTSFAPVGSSTPIARKDKGKHRVIHAISESGDSPLGITVPSDEGSTDESESAPSTFYREPTPGFDFDLDGPGPSSPFSRELSSSEWPSPRTPWLFFEADQTHCAAVEVTLGSPNPVEMKGFDEGKSLEVLWYELGRCDSVLYDGVDASC